MDKIWKIIIGLLVSVFLLMTATANLMLVEVFHNYRLLLTSDGCGYAKSIGLPIENDQGQCSVIIRFTPDVFGGGGTLHMADNQKINITESMLLATSKIEGELPLDHISQNHLNWFWRWSVVAYAVGAVTLIYGLMRARKTGKYQ